MNLGKYGVNIRLEPVIYIGDRRALDIRGIYLISRMLEGYSLYTSSKITGIPYSRAWEYIRRLEEMLQVKLFRFVRGRGGISLTDDGRRILSELIRALKPHIDLDSINISPPTFRIVGSDDPLLRKVSRYMGGELKINVEYRAIGSLIGLFKVLIGDGDIASIHLSGANEVIELFGVKNLLMDVFRYDRLIGWIYRGDIDFNGVEDLIKRGYRLANRVWGSGSRIYLEEELIRYAETSGLDLDDLRGRINGYGMEYYSHVEALRSIKDGLSDVMIGTYYEAKVNGFKFLEIRWETFELYVRRDRYEELIPYISSIEEFASRYIYEMDGYRLGKN